MSHFRNLFAIYCAVVGLFSGVVWASFAWAAPAAPAETQVIQGKVAFEQRYTVVQMEFCAGDRTKCPKSEPYWTLVVGASDGHRYELNQPFSMGSLTPPESVEIDSVILRPGSVLQLEAQVDPISADYSLIQKILKLQLAMDAQSDEEPAIPSFGWSCQSLDGETRVVALLGSTGYGLRVETVDRAAEFSGATLEVTGNSLVYVGTSGEATAELHILSPSPEAAPGVRREGLLTFGQTLELSCFPTR